MTQKATIAVAGLKVAVPLAADALPRDLVPMDGPPGEPILELVLGDGPLTAAAKINGRNYRRMLKTIDERPSTEPYGLMARLMYGAGLRLMECCRLRVKDIDLEREQLTVGGGKGKVPGGSWRAAVGSGTGAR